MVTHVDDLCSGERADLRWLRKGIEKEFGINQFKIEDVDLLKNNLDLIVHVKEKQSRNNKVVGCSIIIC